ncbi:Na+/H+ antiporter NhaA [Streptomyces sp. E11-3]|uniref:Na+/H+ antiporter NhaA n=1 Tax=Streptomyces sp. E11-3 TaxID=3110112 RepID=UPI003980D90E
MRAKRPGNGRGNSSRWPPFFGLLPRPERSFVLDALRTETVGGTILLAATAAALIWANSGWGSAYESVREAHFGFGPLDLSVHEWASDGLLAIFFFVAGAELKRELVVGELSTVARAVLPVVAALSGMVIPALVYGLVATSGGGTWNGWAVPMATDIAFALGVLAVVNTHLPSALRAFLLTLAVVDDLGAIIVIAIFFTSTINLAALGGAVLGLGLFYWLHHVRRVRGWYWYLPLAFAIWALMYTSGVHATVAGVALGLMLRITRRGSHDPHRKGTAEHIVHLTRPVSAGLAVPLFALFAAGVSVSGDTLAEVLGSAEPLGVALGLALGKTVGIFGGTYLAARFTRAQINPDLAWADVLALSLLGGVGFTVSLLIGELAYPDPAHAEPIKAAVLLGSLAAALGASVLLKLRNAKYRRLYEAEAEAEAETDADTDAETGTETEGDE